MWRESRRSSEAEARDGDEARDEAGDEAGDGDGDMPPPRGSSRSRSSGAACGRATGRRQNKHQGWDFRPFKYLKKVCRLAQLLPDTWTQNHRR